MQMQRLRLTGWLAGCRSIAHSAEQGQVLVLGALMLTVLLGMAGLATDVGLAMESRRAAQTAADAAALAGASDLALNQGSGATARADALSQSAKNSFTNGSGGVTVTVNSPPATGPNSTGANANNSVEVIITKQQPTFLLRALTQNPIPVTARAVATGYGASTTPQIALLDPSQPESFDVGITGAVNYPVNITIDGPLTVNSNDSWESEQTHNNYHVIAPTNVVGGRIDQLGNGTIGPGYTTLNSPITDPLAGTVNPPPTTTAQGTGIKCPSGSTPNSQTTCTGGATPLMCNVSENTNPPSCIVHHYNTMLNPGVWKDITCDDNCSHTLNPGTYIITGSLQLIDGPTGPGSITGSGVTLYFACPLSSAPYWQTCPSNGGATNANGSGPGGFLNLTGSSTGLNPESGTHLLTSRYSLTPPTSGTYKGLTIYYDRNNHLPLGDPQTEDHHAALEASCNANQTLAGTIYGAGTRALWYSTTQNSACTIDSCMVLDTLEFDGLGDAHITCNASTNLYTYGAGTARLGE